jgi:hypothetical protein
MSFTLLFHVLAMSNLAGLLVPEIFISRQYRLNTDWQKRHALASFHVKLTQWTYVILLVTVLTGIGRVMEAGYPWFAFSTMFWLAAKQSLGMVLVAWVLLTWSGLRMVAKNLRSGSDSEAETMIALRDYERIKGRSHVITGLAWVMVALAVLKI